MPGTTDAAGPREGDPAPDFELPAAGGVRVRLRDLLLRGPVVLYFYPKDFTPSCTIESCGFRDQYQDFLDAGAEVVGISTDPSESHERFAARHRLPFLLLSDAGGVVRSAYGVPKILGVLGGRVTFVIDRDGTVAHRFRSQFRPKQHVERALATLRGLVASRTG